MNSGFEPSPAVVSQVAGRLDDAATFRPEAAERSGRARAADFVTLTKPRLNAILLLTTVLA